MQSSPLTISCDGYVIKITRPGYIIMLTVKIDNITVQGEQIMTEFTKVGQFVEFDVKVLDSRTPPRPAQIEGDITVQNSNEVASSVFFDQTARHGKLTCTDEGTGQVTFTADANLDPNATTPIIAILSYVCNLAGATVLVVEAGPVQEPVA